MALLLHSHKTNPYFATPDTIPAIQDAISKQLRQCIYPALQLWILYNTFPLHLHGHS